MQLVFLLPDGSIVVASPGLTRLDGETEAHYLDRAALMLKPPGATRLIGEEANSALASLQPTLDDAKTAAKASIRQQSAAARDLWRTPGKDAVYQEKRDEITAWTRDGCPADLSAYPHISSETGVTKPTALELVALWCQMAAAWRAASGQIDGTEQSAFAAVEAATTNAEAEAAAQDLTWPEPPMTPPSTDYDLLRSIKRDGVEAEVHWRENAGVLSDDGKRYKVRAEDIANWNSLLSAALADKTGVMTWSSKTVIAVDNTTRAFATSDSAIAFAQGLLEKHQQMHDYCAAHKAAALALPDDVAQIVAFDPKAGWPAV